MMRNDTDHLIISPKKPAPRLPLQAILQALDLALAPATSQEEVTAIGSVNQGGSRVEEPQLVGNNGKN